MKLRPYQEEGLEKIREKYRIGDRSVLYVLPTGGGKTVLFCHMAAEAVGRGKVVWVLVHRIELLRQTYKTVSGTQIHTACIAADYTGEPAAPIQVAMVQTLKNRLKRYPKPDLIIVDEAHHTVAGTWRYILEENPQAYVLGVTATPTRVDGKPLGSPKYFNVKLPDGSKQYANYGLFDSIVIGPQISWLMNEGFLCKTRLKRPPTVIDLSEVKYNSKGEFDLFSLEKAVDKPSITGDAVLHYKQFAHNKPAVAFCVSIKHADHVAAQFREAGYRAYSVDCDTDEKVREKILSGLGNGSVHVVCSCDIISEGTDIPAIYAAINLRPTESLGLYLQQNGRALRPVYANGFDLSTVKGRLDAIAASDKPYALILDHVGNCFRHGRIEQDRNWDLDGIINGKRKKQKIDYEAQFNQCKECFHVFDKHLDECPECWTPAPVIIKKPKGNIAEKQGALIDDTGEVDSNAIRLAKEAKQLAKLRAIAKNKGIPDSWAFKKFEEWKRVEKQKNNTFEVAHKYMNEVI